MKILVSCPEEIFSFGQDKNIVCDEGKKVKFINKKNTMSVNRMVNEKSTK